MLACEGFGGSGAGLERIRLGSLGLCHNAGDADSTRAQNRRGAARAAEPLAPERSDGPRCTWTKGEADGTY